MIKIDKEQKLVDGAGLPSVMKKQTLIELFGQPITSTAETMEYNTFEYKQGLGYILTFTIQNDSVSKIQVYLEK